MSEYLITPTAITSVILCVLSISSMSRSKKSYISCPKSTSISRSSTPGSALCENTLKYPITQEEDLPIAKMKDDRPSLNNKGLTNECYYKHILMSKKYDFCQKMNILCNHNIIPELSGIECDVDCHNMFISELYESFLLKFLIENLNITYDIVQLHKKIFDSFDPIVVQQQYNDWVAINPALFPANQKNRDWSKYHKEQILKNIVGLEHDPTKLLLSGGFLKQLQHSLPEKFTMTRNYVFNNILKRARGYRTNLKIRNMSEPQIGITSFDLDELNYNPTYYDIQPWKHPGRSICGTLPIQGMYEHSAYEHFIPLKCGISGSTNFWIWTALFSGVNFTIEETRMFVLSSYIVLGSDGGHSLNEVLSSCTLSSIYWKYYKKYATDPYLSNFIDGSTFANNLYKITKDINPIGDKEIICIDFDQVANWIYNGNCSTDFKSGDSGKNGKNDQVDQPKSNCHFPAFHDKKSPADDLVSRQEIEAFFLIENDRINKPFGAYSIFLDQLSPEVNNINNESILNVIQYIKKYCS